jgi:hypothetical protein
VKGNEPADRLVGADIISCGYAMDHADFEDGDSSPIWGWSRFIQPDIYTMQVVKDKC